MSQIESLSLRKSWEIIHNKYIGPFIYLRFLCAYYASRQKGINKADKASVLMEIIYWWEKIGNRHIVKQCNLTVL